jgi:hypothetical protein
MAILREPKVWTRPRRPTLTHISTDLTPEEQANVGRALRFLFAYFGGWVPLAAAMGLNAYTVRAATGRARRPITSGLALRAAKVARVRVESILAGKWPTPLTRQLKRTMAPVKRVGRGPTMR